MDMGTQNKGHGTIRNLKDIEKARSSRQKSIDKKKNMEERRRFGQFSTPYELAKEIVSFGLGLLDTDEITFLEPCIGSGAFYSALLNTITDDYIIKSATGIEIDSVYFECAKSLWCDTGINIINDNFADVKPDRKYNFVLTNPPYVRHHYLAQDEKKHLEEAGKKETGIALSGLAGLYCHFILLANKWLAPNAICGWLVPSEFMDVNYGSAMKDYLLNHVHLLRVHRYDPDNSMFSDALVSSCVIWFKNEVVAYDYDVEFTFSGTHNKPMQKKQVKKSELMKERKWTRFPKKEIRSEEIDGATLGDFFEIKRGLATGDNNFFIMSRDKIAELGMDMSFFKPILPSPRYLKTNFIGSDRNGIPQIDPQYFLLDCVLSEQELEKKSPATWDYLQSGVEKTSKKYLCKSRKKWYWQEQRESTYFLCSYMGRGKGNSSPIRFILNLSKAVATNSYLMLYPKAHLQQAILAKPDSVYKIWEILKSIDGNEIEEEGRVYGGGLKKIEPRELAKVPCCDLIDLCMAK